MAQLILFGGGDGGGLLIGSHGVRPVPPFNSDIRLQLHGVSALLNGKGATSQESVNEMGTLSHRLSNLIFAEVEHIVGPLEGEHSLIYQSERGGFYCGSMGKAPVAFTWPPDHAASIQDLITNGIVERELVDFVEAALKQKMDILELLENPAHAAGKLGIRLSERSSNDLHRLAPSELSKIEDPVTREVVEFFYAVAKDGRFLSTWTKRPYAVAAELKVTLSEPAIDQVLYFNSGAMPEPAINLVTSVVNTVVSTVVTVVVSVVIKLVTPKPKVQVTDSSGVPKF